MTMQASLERPAYLSAVNFVFIAISGRVVPRERCIVGGTGEFRMAELVMEDDATS